MTLEGGLIYFITPTFYLESIDEFEREGIFDDEKTLKYAERMRLGDIFPPAEMFFCNYERGQLCGSDGRHRAAAAILADKTLISVIIKNKRII